YIRDFGYNIMKHINISIDVGTIGFKETGRFCDHCKGKLYDVLLDWDDALPEKDLKLAKKHCKKADLILCLGTSLRVEPANELPLLGPDDGKLVIVNLQKTPKDKFADLCIHYECDKVMKSVMEQLNI